MKATCPEDKNHKRFVTIAHVTEDWVVDENGAFVEVSPDTCGQTINGPDPRNTWYCEACHCKAIVTDQ